MDATAEIEFTQFGDVGPVHVGDGGLPLRVATEFTVDGTPARITVDYEDCGSRAEPITVPPASEVVDQSGIKQDDWRAAVRPHRDRTALPRWR